MIPQTQTATAGETPHRAALEEVIATAAETLEMILMDLPRRPQAMVMTPLGTLPTVPRSPPAMEAMMILPPQTHMAAETPRPAGQEVMTVTAAEIPETILMDHPRRTPPTHMAAATLDPTHTARPRRPATVKTPLIPTVQPRRLVTVQPTLVMIHMALATLAPILTAVGTSLLQAMAGTTMILPPTPPAAMAAHLATRRMTALLAS